MESGAAYYCFCSERRLDLLRKEATRNRQVPKYDNKCRNLDVKEIMFKLHSGIDKCVRLKVITIILTNSYIFNVLSRTEVLNCNLECNSKYFIILIKYLKSITYLMMCDTLTIQCYILFILK